MSEIITRFPPSPTGLLHIGGVRTALFSYLFARQNSGKFIFRIEDTDKERSKKEYEEDIIKGLKWLGLEWDNKEIIRQSERVEIYKKYLEKLIAEGKAFVSKEDSTEENKRSEVIRLKNPRKDIIFNDLIRGEVKFNTAELGDIVIAKSFEEPLYHFAVVIDDKESGVTHIIRGEDHISNTPRQILIQEALDFDRLEYAHIPLVLAADRSKLSKRNGAVSLSEFINQGYLPEAILNYLALLGWHPEDNKEIFTKEELIKVFDLLRVQKGGAIWNTEKLDWVNKEHLKKMDKELRIKNYEIEIEKTGIKNYKKEILEKLEPILTERINKFGDIKDLADGGELAFFFGRPVWQKEGFLWKGEGDLKETVKRIKQSAEFIGNLSDGDFSKDSIKNALWSYAETEGRGKVLWPVRYALSGLPKSPDPFIIGEVLGKAETIGRLNSAADFLTNA